MEISTSDAGFGIRTPVSWPEGGRLTFGESMGSRFVALFDVPGTVLENIYSWGHMIYLTMSCLSGMFDLRRHSSVPRLHVFPDGNCIPDDPKRSRTSRCTTVLVFIFVRDDKEFQVITTPSYYVTSVINTARNTLKLFKCFWMLMIMLMISNQGHHRFGVYAHCESQLMGAEKYLVLLALTKTSAERDFHAPCGHVLWI
jgi:hypothetical protein